VSSRFSRDALCDEGTNDDDGARGRSHEDGAVGGWSGVVWWCGEVVEISAQIGLRLWHRSGWCGEVGGGD